MDFQKLITVLRTAETKEEMNDRREEMAGVIPDLLKVRNLGKKGQIQTVEKIHALGLKMNGE